MFFKSQYPMLLKTHSSALFHLKNIKSTFQTTNYSNLANLINFNKEESDKILEIVNNTTAEDLINYDISKVRSKKILAHRLKHGEFQDLEGILQIDGFGIKILEKFGKSILNNNIKSSGNLQKDLIAKQSNKFTIPIVSDEIRNTCKSCTSLHIGMSSVTWSRMELNANRPCELTHWQHSDISYKKLHINDLIQRSIYLDYNIPLADCYIFENPQTAQTISPGNANQVNMNIQKSQLIAILGYGLSKRNCKMLNDEDMEKYFNDNNVIENITKFNSNIFYLKRFVSARLFNTLIGTEKVSTEQNVLELMRTHYNLEDKSQCDNEKDENLIKIKGTITIPMNLRQIYMASEGYQREFLGQSLLLGLTFMRLAILKCPYSIDKLTKRSTL